MGVASYLACFDKIKRENFDCLIGKRISLNNNYLHPSLEKIFRSYPDMASARSTTYLIYRQEVAPVQH
jgi:hypothetical protein